MAGRGELERVIRELVGEAPVAIELAQIVAPLPNPFNPALSPMVKVLIQPGNRPAEMRLVSIGQSPGRGLFQPVVPGSEVLCLLPGGDPNRGVALAGLSSGASVAPLPTDGSTILLDFLGVTLRSLSGLPASAIVKGDLLTGGPPGVPGPFGGLASWLLAVEVYIQANAIAAPLTAPAAAAFNLSTGATPVLPSPFTAAALVSANPVTAGGPPYASALHKVTD